MRRFLLAVGGESSSFQFMKISFPSKGLLQTAFLLFVAHSAMAVPEVQHPEKPLLWEIGGKDLEKPSYLFGTIHLGAEAVTTLHPAAREAFDGAESVYTEVPMDAASQLAAAPLTIRKDGKTLNESLGEELSILLDEELEQINPVLDSTPFQPLATWVVSISLPLLPDQLTGKVALDKVLWDEAEAAGKDMGALETVVGQLGIFTEMTEEEQVAMLSETLKNLKKDRTEGRNRIGDLTDAYIQGDVAKVEMEMTKAMAETEGTEHQEFTEKFMKRLLADRDVTMAASIAEVLEKEPGTIHFFAAGALHFHLGDKHPDPPERSGLHNHEDWWMRVAVIGCGAAGAAAAVFQKRAGNSVTVFEQAPECRAVGAGFLLQPSGMDVLGELGIYE